MIDVTVKVPEDRIAEFYAWFGSWLSGEFSDADEAEEADSDYTGVSYWTAEDQDLANELWSRFNDRARALFTTLFTASPHRFTGQELADLLDVPNGSNGVAGVLAWPGRYCKQVGRRICWNVKWTEDNLALYSMEGVLADLFRKASSSQSQSTLV